MNNLDDLEVEIEYIDFKEHKVPEYLDDFLSWFYKEGDYG